MRFFPFVHSSPPLFLIFLNPGHGRHWPIGLIYDNHTTLATSRTSASATARTQAVPLRLILHLASPPTDKLLLSPSAESCKQAFMGQLKEADFLRWGNTKRMTGLRKAEQDGMWEGIKERASVPPPPPSSIFAQPVCVCVRCSRAFANAGYFFPQPTLPTPQIISMTTGAWHRRSHQPPYQRDRVLHRLRNHRCTPVPRPRTRRALRTETARITCAACRSDCIYPKGPYYRIWHRPFSKMVRHQLAIVVLRPYHMAGPQVASSLPVRRGAGVHTGARATPLRAALRGLVFAPADC